MRSVFFYKQPRRSLREDTDWRWWFSAWAPVVVAIAVICAESTRTFSAQNTSSWLRPIFEHWFGAIQDSAWDSFHHYLRKTGHFVGYGTVALTFLRAWLHTLAKRGPTTLLVWRLEASILAIFSTVVIAACDEFHQTFVPGRTGTPVDVLLDTCGATALCLLVWLICWSKRTQAQEA